MIQVEIYSKKDCHLCDEAKAVLARVRERIPFELIEVDIEQDAKLFEQFKYDVPVVYVDGRRAFKHRVDEQDFATRLERGRAFAMGTLDPRTTLTRGKPVARTTKVVFSVVAAAGLLGVFVNEWYQKTVVERRMEIASLDFEPEGFAAPAFELPDDQGHARSLADYRGKVVLLNFWASWCPPCRDEMPSMAHLAEALRDKPDFAMVALSVDDDWDAVHGFFKGQRPAFQVLLDKGARVSQAYGTVKYPESYVIDRDGRVIAKFVGPREWDEPAAIGYFESLVD
ncbi:MAG TPA: redoxin domain-containing protein [Myxococcales bacterium]|nr:redoxin domain-containing protein [Myxococcales bacterium]